MPVGSTFWKNQITPTKLITQKKTREKFERGKMGYWAVIVVLMGVLVLSQDGIGGIAQPLRTGYACWGGCYNECILQTGINPSERLPCYMQCLGSCVANPASGSDNQYYCQLGCSLEQCVSKFSSGMWYSQSSLSSLHVSLYICIGIAICIYDKHICMYIYGPEPVLHTILSPNCSKAYVVEMDGSGCALHPCSSPCPISCFPCPTGYVHPCSFPCPILCCIYSLNSVFQKLAGHNVVQDSYIVLQF